MKTSLVDFLQDELKIGEIPAIALRRCEQNPSLLPMILWQYGLISLQQLDLIFDWLETA